MPAARRGRPFWSRLIAQYEKRPVAHEEFAAEHDVRVATFRAWLYRLRREGTSTTPDAPIAARFVEVTAHGAAVACRVRAGESVFEFGELPPPAYIAELARSLAS